MNVRQVDLANRWGVSRAAVSKMWKVGMPLDSVEAAETWRREFRGWNGGIKFSSLPCSGGAAGGEAATPRTTPPAADTAAAQGDGLDGLLARAIIEERVAYIAVQDARRAVALAGQKDREGSFAFDFAAAFKRWCETAPDSPEKGSFASGLSQAFKGWAADDADRRKAKGSFAYDEAQALKAWRAASAFRVQAEKDWNEHRVRLADLVPMAAALELVERAHRPLRKLLKAMPSTLRARCNPAAPDVAGQALGEWTEEALRVMSKEIRRG